MNAFDTSGPSSITKELSRSANGSKSMSQWVERRRKAGIDPCGITLGRVAKLPQEVTIKKGKK